MNRYDTYSPEIVGVDTSSPDSYNIESTTDKVDEQQPTRRGRRNVSPDDKPSKDTKTNKKDGSKGTLARMKEIATGQSVRLLIGLFLCFFGVYLSVAFVSYLGTCVADQSVVENVAIGTAHGVQNSAGEGGARLSSFLINDCFGVGSAVIIFWLFSMSLKLFGSGIRFKSVNFTIKCLVALIALSLIVGLITISNDWSINLGGYHGRYVNQFIIDFTGWIGAVLLCLFVIALFVAICLRDIIKWVLRLKRERSIRRAEAAALKEAENKKARDLAELSKLETEEMAAAEVIDTDVADQPVAEDDKKMTFGAMEYSDEESAVDYDPITYETDEATTENESQKVEAETVVDSVETIETADPSSPMVVNVNHIEESSDDESSFPIPDGIPGTTPYKFPPFEILREGKARVVIDREEQMENEEKIRKTLHDFGINILSIEATIGPTITLYEIVPDKGTKIAKIRGLVDDIALSLAAIGVRIIAPIPGRGTVGIEVANKDPQIVSMRTVLKSKKFQESKCMLPMAIGTTISNEVYVADLADMPHLLVAGATGQGKSVGLNAIIASLLYSKSPDELKFVMVDPKMVEFSLYSKIEKHYLAKIPDADEAIITDVSKVVATLNSLCVEMENRYKLLKDSHSRKFVEYNDKIKAHKLDPREGHRFLPYIVVIIDEFSDLFMTAGKDVEMPIARLAQMARAVGMHVIIATQRPSVNVITGLIKSNFPARIAFKTSSGSDSKTILDCTGAQQLIGKGDMLISHRSELVRVQCAFIDTPEVEEICDYISRQPYGRGAYILPEPPAKTDGVDEGPIKGGGFNGEIDSLFEEAARSIISSNTASVSSLQRRFSVGYNRAGKIMDQLERYGIVGPQHDGKPRSVLVDQIELDNILIQIRQTPSSAAGRY
jgi:S-DNA-T family DNA segregation ATPase FtsK/SpoIIIE